MSVIKAPFSDGLTLLWNRSYLERSDLTALEGYVACSTQRVCRGLRQRMSAMIKVRPKSFTPILSNVSNDSFHENLLIRFEMEIIRYDEKPHLLSQTCSETNPMWSLYYLGDLLIR